MLEFYTCYNFIILKWLYVITQCIFGTIIIDTYDIAKEKGMEAENMSTSDEGALLTLSQKSPMRELKKRVLKRPQFYEEVKDYKNTSKFCVCVCGHFYLLN